MKQLSLSLPSVALCDALVASIAIFEFTPPLEKLLMGY